MADTTPPEKEHENTPQWLGRHNHDDHHPGMNRAWSLTAGEWCYPDDWCYDCKLLEHGDPWDALDRVRTLHAPQTNPDNPDTAHLWCAECYKVRGGDGNDWNIIAWPCATIRALENSSPEPQYPPLQPNRR